MGSCRLCRGWICFCIVPIDGRKFPCHDEVVKMAFAKTMTPRALANSPIDFVSAEGTVRVQQNFISGLSFSLIDFLG